MALETFDSRIFLVKIWLDLRLDNFRWYYEETNTILQISIDGDDRTIFWRLKPLILEFFWLKFGLIYASIISDGTMKKQTRTDSISNVFIFLFTIV